MGQSVGIALVIDKLLDERQTQLASRGGELEGFVEPDLRLRDAGLAGENAGQAGHAVHILGVFFQPRRIVLCQAVLIVGPQEDILDLAADFAEQPAFRIEFGKQLFEIGDALALPWIIRSYHDVFKNAGYETEREETFRGTKDGVPIQILISLLRRGEATP